MNAKDIYLITDVPNYDPKPGYQILKKATYRSIGLVKLLSGHNAFHIINFQDVKKILIDRNCIRSLSNKEVGPSILPTLTPKDMLLNLGFPDHLRLKQFISKDYSISGLKWLEPVIISLTKKYSDTISTKENVDIFTDVLDKVASETNCVLLGIPLEDQHYFRKLSHTVQVANPNDVEELINQFELLYSYMMDHVQGRRYHSNDGLIAKCLRNRAYSTPPINDEELTAILLGSLLGGDQNTLTVMTKIIYGLLSIPELWRKLHCEPKLIHLIIEEMLRLTNLGNASCFPRIATHDLQLITGNIPKGAAVYADVMLANRDPDVFPQPLHINPLRAFNQHLQFGYGMHNCMGQELVRLEINAVVSFLSHKFPNMKLSNEKLDCVTWTEGIVLRRPNELPVIL